MIKNWTFLFLIFIYFLHTKEPLLKSNYSPSSSCHVYANVSLLYWQAVQDGLQYGITNPTGTQLFPNQGGTSLNANFKYKPAFEVALGIQIPPNAWKVGARYLRFHQTITSSSSAPQPLGNIITTWLTLQNLGFAQSAQSTWGLKYDQLDLELSKCFHIGKNLSIKPLFGIRMNKLDQTFTINYENVTPNTGNIFSNEALSLNTSDSWALGPKGGVLTNWLIAEGFRLIGQVSASIVYTKYKINHNESNASNTLLQANVKNNVSYLRPMTEMRLGFGWGSFFTQSIYYLDIAILYDFNILTNQNGMSTLLNSSQGNVNHSFGDLYFHGLSVRIQLEF